MSLQTIWTDPQNIMHRTCLVSFAPGRPYLSWRAEKQQKVLKEIADVRQQLSQCAMSLDLISNLARIVTESEAVEAMLDVYAFLFAPQSSAI